MSKKSMIIFLTSVFVIVVSLIICYYFISNSKTDKDVDVYTYLEDQTENKENEKSKNVVNNNDEILKNLPKPLKTNARVPVFMYHFVTDEKITAWDIENYMTMTKLEEQFKYIKDNFYEPVYISEFDELYKYTKPVAITVDDGFLFYDTAFQLIKKYRIKVTLSIIVNYINNPKFLTTEQIKEIRDSGLVEIQSHTLSHRKLATLKDNEIKEELEKSKEVLKNDYNIYSDVICYPIGSYDKRVIKASGNLYKFGLKMDGGVYDSKKDNNFEISRIYANRTMSMKTFISYLEKSKVENIWK